MRVYKFLSLKYGLKAICNRRLKIAEIPNLNDPFDLMAVDLSDSDIRERVLRNKREIGKTSGLLCFSRHWENSVIWAHYADSHRGLCLGFEVPEHEPENNLWEFVEYKDEPRKFVVEELEGERGLQIAKELNFTKYKHWQYEEEVRMWVGLASKSKDFYFYDFGDTLRLKEVIVGCSCQVSNRSILTALGSLQHDVAVLKARPSYNSFKMVEDAIDPDGK